MKTNEWRWFAVGTALTGCLGLGCPFPATAGDPIIFSNKKDRTELKKKEGLLDREALEKKKLEPGGSPANLIVTDPGPVIAPRNKQEDRRQRNAEDERKNWMVVDPGQLQSKDEENRAFGIRTVELEEDGDGRKDYFFSPRSETEGDRSIAGKSRSAPLRSPSVRGQAYVEEDRSAPILLNRTGEGGETGSEANQNSRDSGGIALKPLMGSDVLSKSSQDKAPPLLRDYSAARPPAGRSREDQARRQSSTGPAFSSAGSEPRSPGLPSDAGNRAFGGLTAGATPPLAPIAPKVEPPRSGAFGTPNPGPGFSRPLPSMSSGLAPSEPYSARKPAFSSGGAQSGFGTPPVDNNRNRSRADYSLPSRTGR